MTADPRYVGYLRTGSGSQEVLLELGTDTAQITVLNRWPGQHEVPARCELRFRHRVISDRHGWLELVDAAAAATAEDELLPLPALSDDEVLLPLIVEYLRLPETTTFIHPGSTLHVMRAGGYAEWNDVFELLLLVNDPEGWPTSQPWPYLQDCIDKTGVTRLEA